MMRSKKIMMVLLISLLVFPILSFFMMQIPYVYAETPPAEEKSAFEFEDVEVGFIVYPDGHVVIAVASNSTGGTFPYLTPEIHGFVDLAKNDNLTSASADFTFIVPSKYAEQFPFNSTNFSLAEEYSEGLDSISVNCSVVLPLDAVSKFPFNSTDFEITGEYSDMLATGTVTVHILPGFALGDLNVDFRGNRTYLTLNGSATVAYGSFYNFELDEDSLDQMLLFGNTTILGTGSGSLYDRTDGLLECTRLETTKTSTNGGAIVDFEVEIRGEDFIQALASLMYKGVPGLTGLIPGQIPTELPDEKILFSILNATFYSTENASFQLAYTHSQRKIELKLATVEYLEKIKKDATLILPETVPPEVKQLTELLLNKTYCSVKSYKESIAYANRVAEIEAACVIEGDLNAEINYLKSVLLTYFAEQPISSSLQSLPWQMSFVNETEMDVSNLRCGFDVTETSAAFGVEELIVFPPIDSIDATSFKLERFFNLTEDSKFPGEGETLKVTIAGGGNTTHSIRLTRPETVPEPDITISDNRVMIWYNQTLSALKDMIFNVQLEAGATVSTIMNPEYVSATSPFTVNATENAGALLDVTEVSKSVTVIIRNVTALADVGSPPGTFRVLGNYVEVTPSETDIRVSATIRVYYTPEQLSAAGLDEATLKIHYWNATLNEWIAVDSQVNTSEHYVSATIEHFSLWVLMGQPAMPIWTQLWFWAVISALLVIVVVVLAYAVRRRKPSP